MILFEEGWHEHAVDHLKSEALARGLIRNAAAALLANHSYASLMFWIEAALGGACVINVLKGPHQPKGIHKEVHHLRMRLFIEGSKKGELKTENTAFTTDFHLYATILNPEADPAGRQLRPTKLTYRTAWHDPTDAGYTEVPIIGARVLTNNLK